jgi:pimeloyl-ACP methyl ester carboxylesterase
MTVPAVFVHGVPDTKAFWDPVLAALDRTDAIALALPGFASPRPDGFGATKEEYTDWVAEQITALGAPVDLVGHDWGALMTQRLVLTRPELVRTFTMADAAITESFRWHELAVQWQTPEVGEQIMAFMQGDVAVAALRDQGHPDPEGCVAAIDDTMRECILALYRSAVDIAREWAPTGKASRPGLVVAGTDDPYASPGAIDGFAELVGAQLVRLDAGHWAPAQRPVEMAVALTEHWAQSA